MYNSTGSSSDYNMFLSAFGLNSYGGSLVTVHPGGAAHGCSDPGLAVGVKEVTLDVGMVSGGRAWRHNRDWTVAARQWNIDREPPETALHNRINGNPLPLPEVISNSYGECEARLTDGLTQIIDEDYEQAGLEGVSVFASSGDGGPTACEGDGGPTACETELNYSNGEGLSGDGYASSPHVVVQFEGRIIAIR